MQNSWFTLIDTYAYSFAPRLSEQEANLNKKLIEVMSKKTIRLTFKVILKMMKV